MKKSLGSRALAFSTPVWVVGTYGKDGKPNVMPAAWGGICCSKPACVYVSLRKKRYSYNNIVDRQAYTISIPSEKFAKEADYFGIASGRNTDKLSATGLTAVKSDLVDAPYIDEFPLVLECKVLHTIEIGVHTQFIGEIMDVKADEAVIGEKGWPDIEKVKPIIYGPGIDTYHGIGKFLGKAFSIGKEI